MERITALEDAIARNNLTGIHSVFYTIAHGDPNFSTNKFREVFQYVKSKNIEGFLTEFDGEVFEPEENWNEEYWALVASSLIDNFCEERIDHLEQVGRKVYPIQINPVQADQSEAGANPVRQRNSEGISKGEKRHMSRPISEEEKQRRSGLISEEEKRQLKADHARRNQKDVGGFLKNLFGARR